VWVEDSAAYLVNPGSVGQPRDHDPRAAYAVYDSEARRVDYHRVDYDILSTVRKILDAGLPEVLGLRLTRGV
jgi:diadenosine tetraphosphatase ApaH/serine/threonine PP2A family protein phosphatase